MNWEEILYYILAAGLLYFLYQFVRKQKDAFSATNLIKSMYTLGILALGLILFISYCVWMLKSSQNF